MATVTPNFNWPVPTSTDLVKDGATAIEALGDSIDASLVDLKGGTTGQVLSKTSGTDMDFTWVTSDDANAIQNTIVDAKGDLIAASANDTPARLAVGNNGETLVADSSTATGLRYQGNFAAGKNKIINGDFGIWQRGTSAISAAGGGRSYSADRWFGQIAAAGAGVFTMEQATDVPASALNSSPYSIKLVVTTADASTAALEQYFVGQVIEAPNFAAFQFGTASAQTITISFWVKSSITGTFGFDIRNSAADRSYVSTYTISAANTWEKKSITIAGDTSGTWLKDTGIGARMEWTLNAGTDYQTATPNAWTASNDMTTSSQTNWVATLSNTFFITAVQVEAGSVATGFQTATGTIQGELAACQRYYWRSTGGSAFSPYGNAMASATTAAQGFFQFPITMRVAPTSIDFSTLGLTDSAATFALTGLTLSNASPFATLLAASGLTGLTTNRYYQIVNNNSTSGYLGFSAEL